MTDPFPTLVGAALVMLAVALLVTQVRRPRQKRRRGGDGASFGSDGGCEPRSERSGGGWLSWADGDGGGDGGGGGD